MNKNFLFLPDLKIEYFSGKAAQELLLIGGGRPPMDGWLKETAAGRLLWCIDHGIDCCYRLGLLPKQLIGDGDSASPQAWSWAAKNHVPIAKFPVKKDYTDTQLAFEMAASSHCFVILTGALGGRFDHAFSTIFSFGHSSLNGCIADEKEAVFFLRHNEAMTLHFHQIPKAVSLLPLTEKADDVCIDGVYWPLKNATISQSLTYTISNEISINEIHVSLGKGILAVYICWQEDS